MYGLLLRHRPFRDFRLLGSRGVEQPQNMTERQDRLVDTAFFTVGIHKESKEVKVGRKLDAHCPASGTHTKGGRMDSSHAHGEVFSEGA